MKFIEALLEAQEQAKKIKEENNTPYDFCTITRNGNNHSLDVSNDGAILPNKRCSTVYVSDIICNDWKINLDS